MRELLAGLMPFVISLWFGEGLDGNLFCNDNRISCLLKLCVLQSCYGLGVRSSATNPMIISTQSDLPQDSETLGILRKSVADFCTAETSLATVRTLRGKTPGFDPTFWKKLAEQGWLGILVPEEFGGLQLGYGAMRVVAEQLARHLRPEPLTPCAVLCCGVLVNGSNEQLKRALLPQLASGRLFPGFACAEAAADLAAPSSSLSKTGRRASLTGTKHFVVPAGTCDGYIVSARDGDTLVLYWLPTADKKGEVQTQARADGTGSGILKLGGTAVSAENEIARGAIARDILERAADEARVITCAELFGVMDRALEITLEYMRTRVQFRKSIGSFQALQHRVVDLYVQKELALGALDDAARGLGNRVDSTKRAFLASRAKSRCADAALLIGRESIKLHGAMGFADECDIGLYFQRALVLSAWLGNASLQRRRISSLILANDPYAEAVADESNTLENAGPREVENDDVGDWNAMGDDDFRAMVRNYFEAHYPENLRYLNRRARWSENREWALRMSKKGWIAPAWPRERGGMGLSPAKLIIYMEQQERWGVARAPDQGRLMLGPLLMRYDTPEQREQYLSKIISCENIWCQGYSEPNAGSDLASIRTEAIDKGDYYLVNGSKIWTTLAQDATHMFMRAPTRTLKRRMA